jgi:predicted nucleotidyltransferase
MGANKIQSEIKQYIQRLKKSVNPESVILFGSFARGEASEWSDIDLLVIADYKTKQDEKADILYKLHDGLVKNHDINAFGLTKREYEAVKPWSIFADVKKEGLVLYKR